MQILQPLTVGHVRLAPWHILHVTCVDQKDLESSRLQDLKQRDPVHSSSGSTYPQYEPAVTTALSTKSGTILLNGLPKDAPLCFFRPTCRHAWTQPLYRSHDLRFSSFPA